MPRVEDYNVPPPATPEPHFKPGYTGYLPGYGPKRIYQMATTYEKMTHDIMATHPMAGYRLAPILDVSNQKRRDKEDTYYVAKHESKVNDVKLRPRIPVGYAGYIPRKMYYHGESYIPECKKAIAEFERIQTKGEKQEKGLFLPPLDLLRWESPLPALRPHALNKNYHIPNYVEFHEPVEYNRSPYDMSDLDPRKKYIPGYTGYHAGKIFDYGVTYAKGAWQDLCDLTNALQERRVCEERPSIDNWYHTMEMRNPEKVAWGAYEPRKPARNEPTLGYTGHIPSSVFGPGIRYGKGARTFIHERELEFYDGLSTPGM